MHSLDVDGDVRCDVPRGSGGMRPCRRARTPLPAVVDVHPVRRRREAVRAGRARRTPPRRPTTCARGRPLRRRGIGRRVPRRRRRGRRDRTRHVDDQSVRATSMTSSTSVRTARIRSSPSTTEDQTRATARNGFDVTVVVTSRRVAESSAITASRPCCWPALTTRRRSSLYTSSAKISARTSQSRAAKARNEALVRLACGVLQPRPRPAELFEFRDRGVEVGLVEHLAAVDQVAFDCRSVDNPPLGVEAVSRGPFATG